MSESPVEQPGTPAWLARIVDGCKRHERWGVLIGVGLQLLVLVGTIIAGLR